MIGNDFKQPQILDVTLRDGGYLNDWNFSEAEILQVVAVMCDVGLDFVEVGYISEDMARPLGACTPPPLLESIRSMAPTVRIAAMLRRDEDWLSALRHRTGLLDLVRIPCPADRVAEVLDIVAAASELNFQVSVNLTSVSAYTVGAVSTAVKTLNSSHTSLVYIADSRGALTPRQSSALIQRVRALFPGIVGFHAHNNRGLAVKNSVAAASCGAQLIDGSLCGFGLGGGNADLKHLLQAFGKQHAWRDLAPPCSLEATSRPNLADLYRLAGLKNLEQEWVIPLRARYGARLGALLRALPRDLYQDLEQVVSYCSGLSPCG